MKRLVAMLLTVAMLLSMGSFAMAEGKKVHFSISFSDNPTYPFSETWAPYVYAQELANADVTWEVYPNTDYNTKLIMALNTASQTDAMLSVTSQSPTFSPFAASGAFLPINQYLDYLPNYAAFVEEYGIQEELDHIYTLQDGNYYHMPLAYDSLIVNAGLLIREDQMKAYNMEVNTFDDLYQLLKLYKADHPDSYPMTVYQEMANLYNMSLPCYGLSMGLGSSSGSYVLSWDYDKETYFAGAVSQQYKEWLTFFHKLYAEGLLDPEFEKTAADVWSTKLATGSAICSYGWFDQIGSIEANSVDENAAFTMLQPLEGPAGAYWQPNSRSRSGIALSSKLLEREDFEQVLRAIDTMFFSDEATLAFAIGIEGDTYQMVDGEIVYTDKIANDPNGVYKALQIGYGCGAWNTLMKWEKKVQLTKYAPEFTEINNRVDEMGALIGLPLIPKFDDLTQEDISLLIATLSNAFEVWTIGFITGTKDLAADWDAYVNEMKQYGIDQLLTIYNDGLAQFQ